MGHPINPFTPTQIYLVTLWGRGGGVHVKKKKKKKKRYTKLPGFAADKAGVKH